MNTSRDSLSETQRQKLDTLVRRRAAVEDFAADSDVPDRSTTDAFKHWLDFETLPGFIEQRLLRSTGSALGLRDPYFLVHEGDGGARTVIDGRPMINFSSYDYVGMNHHPAVRAAAHAAIDRYGISTSASRLVAGERPIHNQLESALADHYGAAACLSFVSGHATNVATIAALLGPRDLVIHDSLAHNSIVLGAQWSTAARRSFPHNDLAALDATLQAVRDRHERVLIVAEGLYSMDGDVCDLPGLIEIKERQQAWLMIDDAHGLGVLGDRGRGVFERFGADPRRVDIWMGTMSKTLAACGGYIAGPTALIDYLKRSAGSFVYSVGMPPALAATALAALETLAREPERVQRLRRNAREFSAAARLAGLDLGDSVGEAIVPVIVRDSLRAALLSQRLFDRGVNVQPIIAPAIPERLARLRFFLSSEHTSEDIAKSVAALAEDRPRCARQSLGYRAAEPDELTASTRAGRRGFERRDGSPEAIFGARRGAERFGSGAHRAIVDGAPDAGRQHRAGQPRKRDGGRRDAALAQLVGPEELIKDERRDDGRLSRLERGAGRSRAAVVHHRGDMVEKPVVGRFVDEENARSAISRPKSAPAARDHGADVGGLDRVERHLQGRVSILELHAAEAEIDGRRPVGKKGGERLGRGPRGRPSERPVARHVDVGRPVAAARQQLGAIGKEHGFP